MLWTLCDSLHPSIANLQGLQALRSPEQPLTTADKTLSSPLTYNYHTSSQMIKATVGGVPTHNYHTYGVPTIRSDLPAPRIRRVGDSTVSPTTCHCNNQS